jgi:hypothetical protein
MILLAQLSWFVRVIRHKQWISYVKGMADTISLVAAMLKDRGMMRPHWRAAQKELWNSILNSESLVRCELASSQSAPVPVFLKWYFRLF